MSAAEILTTLATVAGSGGGGAALALGGKPLLAWLRARATASAAEANAGVEHARIETTADLTLNERLWARVAQLESRLDKQAEEHTAELRLERAAAAEERRVCDERVSVLQRQINELRTTCERQEDEISALHADKQALAHAAKKLTDEMADLRRHGR